MEKSRPLAPWGSGTIPAVGTLSLACLSAPRREEPKVARWPPPLQSGGMVVCPCRRPLSVRKQGLQASSTDGHGMGKDPVDSGSAGKIPRRMWWASPAVRLSSRRRWSSSWSPSGALRDSTVLSTLLVSSRGTGGLVAPPGLACHHRPSTPRTGEPRARTTVSAPEGWNGSRS